MHYEPSSFKVGQRVRIKSWDIMEKEYSLDSIGDIKCRSCFAKHMKPLCGRLATIETISGYSITLKYWSDSSHTGWGFSTDMIEPLEDVKVEPPKPVKYSLKKAVIETTTVDVKGFTTEQKNTVVEELNRKGFFVADLFCNANDRTGRFHKANFKSGKNLVSLTLNYNTDTLHCVKLSRDERIKLISEISVVLGSTGDYDVVKRGDELHIRDQKIPKDDAIAMARKILEHFKA